MQYTMLSNRFLDKILKEYDYTNISIGTMKPISVDQIYSSLHKKPRQVSTNMAAHRKKKRNESHPKKQDRECTLLNDPTLDSLEMLKIDKAMADMNCSSDQV